MYKSNKPKCFLTQLSEIKYKLKDTRNLRVDNLGDFVCFVALRPKSTAMVMAGQSVHLTTFFLGKIEHAVNQYFVHILSLVTDNNPS